MKPTFGNVQDTNPTKYINKDRLNYRDTYMLTALCNL